MHELVYYVEQDADTQALSGVGVTADGAPMDGLYDLLDEYEDSDVADLFEEAVAARYCYLRKLPNNGLDPVCANIYMWPIPNTRRVIRYWFQPYTRD